MIAVRDSSFVRVVQRLDGMTFENCTFEDCTLVYSGGPVPVLKGNTLTRCGWRFEGAANNTLAMLQLLHHTGGQAVVEKVFEAIRQRQPELEQDPHA